jgi:hypothetical protein
MNRLPDERMMSLVTSEPPTYGIYLDYRKYFNSNYQ